MNRPLVVRVISITGVIVVVAAGVLGIRAYLDAAHSAAAPTPPPATISATTESAYRSAVDAFPYPLPTGDALPSSPPADRVDGPTAARVFVSFFFVCAWQHRYLTAPQSDRPVALTNLEQWARLPASVSGADNSDRVWHDDVVVPASRGDDGAMKRLYRADCAGNGYVDMVTTPARGLVIHQKQLPPMSVEALRNPCVGYPSTAPCDPAFGPNRTVDLGPRAGARGTVTLDGAGVPRAYRVAPDDNESDISERFGGVSLWSLNCYRRSDLTLFAGDTLNLDVYTVATVGDENGSTVPRHASSAEGCLTQSSVPPQQVTP